LALSLVLCGTVLEVLMPTDLPTRKAAQAERADESGQAIFLFYLAFAMFGLVLFAGEARFGMFDGMTRAQAVLTATATNPPVDETAAAWVPASP
jgi:hypothetical protein